MKKLSHYISLNLLSVTGYAIIAFLLLVWFYFYPQAIQESLKANPGDNFEITYGHAMWTIVFIIWFLLAEIIIVLSVTEFILHKNKKDIGSKIFDSIPKKLQKLHSVLFYIGLIFASVPFCFFVLAFF